jgi:signal transduction histidine kinase
MGNHLNKTNMNLDSKLNLFTEWNPNPIIGLNKIGEIIFLNFASRTQFPTLSSLGKKHVLLLGLMEKLIEFSSGPNELVVFNRDIQYLDKIYEQQVFSIPDNETVFIYMNDVTEKKLFETQLGIINADLERRVIERTHELENAKKDAEILAEKAHESSRAKSTFLAMMSHELRTPLNGIMGPVDLLLSTSLTKDQMEYAQMIQDSSNVLFSVVKNVLDYSEQETGRLQIKNTELIIKNFVRDIITETAKQIMNKNLKLDYFIHSDVPESFAGDSAKIRRVLNIFLSNAVKFTDTGEVILNIHLMSPQITDCTDTFVRFEVCDTGVGIPADIREKLFEPFVQGDSSVNRKHGGTGLGLVIAKYLVELLGGTISVKSDVGKGSEFSFTLPLQTRSSMMNAKMKV